MAFTSIHSNTGLFGITTLVPSEEVAPMVKALADQLRAMGTFSADELKMAKNSVRGLLCQNVEHDKVKSRLETSGVFMKTTLKTSGFW